MTLSSCTFTRNGTYQLLTNDAYLSVQLENDRIKLETINQVPFVGNFPRLSALLDDNELQILLFRLIQRTHIEIHEVQKLLLLSSKVVKTPRRSALEQVDDDRKCTRPRTCPSTIPSGDSGGYETQEPVVFEANRDSSETSIPTLRFANLISQHSRYGSKKNGGYFLMRLHFDQDAAILSCLMTSVSASGDSVTTTTSMDFRTSELVGLLKSLDDKQVTVEDLMSSYRRILLRSSDASDAYHMTN